MEQLKKWIEVDGKMMDSVEFTRFIRERAEPEVEKMFEEAIKKERENKARLKQIQETN